jgi:uncharacterized protein YgbK (DUF1537 family)
MSVFLGCIADDLTGATDFAAMVTRAGLRTLMVSGPGPLADASSNYDCIVAALKSRTCPVDEAVNLSLASLHALRSKGAERFYFKYCSTFDSTAQGNIGPVADALLGQLGGDFSIVSPALPENGRTVYFGHLFVNGRLLSESSMRDHPITPMRESRLDVLMAAQSKHKAGLVAYATMSKGADAIREAFAKLRADNITYAVCDVLEDRHQAELAKAVTELPLVTGGSGLAQFLPSAYRAAGLLKTREGERRAAPTAHGPAAIIAGSCSVMTRQQIAHWQKTKPSFRLDAVKLMTGDGGELVRAAVEALKHGPILVYSSAAPEEVQAIKQRFGDSAAAQIEEILAKVAEALVAAGVTRLIVAGGETSGAVVKQLDLKALEVGREIAPGVPWMHEAASRHLSIALKSGNFGDPAFFEKALA